MTDKTIAAINALDREVKMTAFDEGREDQKWVRVPKANANLILAELTDLRQTVKNEQDDHQLTVDVSRKMIANLEANLKLAKETLRHYADIENNPCCDLAADTLRKIEEGESDT